MAEERVERRLAAILAADVVGYSRLMGADERGTLNTLNSHLREFIEPASFVSADITIPDSQGVTPLAHAKQRNYGEIVALFPMSPK